VKRFAITVHVLERWFRFLHAQHLLLTILTYFQIIHFRVQSW
jgi:hypothetical protein